MAYRGHLHASSESPAERRRRVAVEVRQRFLRSRFLATLARFFAWWAGVFVFFCSLTVCPFCGQVGCVGGAASAGVFGGLAAFLVSLMRRALRRGHVSVRRGAHAAADAPDLRDAHHSPCCKHSPGGRQ
jgi:hypothetical protein